MSRRPRAGPPARPPAPRPLERAVARFARERLARAPPPSILVAVSGGPDSTALLLALHALASGRPGGGSGRRAPRPVIGALAVAHVDHGLRPESAAEADHVRRLAASLGLPCLVRRLRLTPGPALQARARAARYGALRQLAARAQMGAAPWLIATGHTADDQAETVLINLTRGTGLAGLAGIPAARDGIVRPLLETTRVEVLAYLEERGLAAGYLCDPSNERPTCLRNRIRLELLPLWERVAGRPLGPVLRRLAEIAAQEEELGERVLAELWSTAGCTPVVARASRPALDGARLRALHPALQRRAVRRWLSDQGATAGYRPAFALVEEVLALAAAGRGGLWLDAARQIAVQDGVLVVTPRADPRHPRAGQREGAARVGRAPAGGAGLEPGGVLISLTSRPQEVRVPGAGRLRLQRLTAGAARRLLAGRHAGGERRAALRAGRLVLFDEEALTPTLVLRPWRPGDRLAPWGMEGSTTVGDLLTDRKVPAAERARQLVLLDGEGALLWVLGRRRGQGADVGPGTRRVLALRWED